MTSRPSTAAPILAALAIVLLPLGAYVAGYFWLGAAQVWYFSVSEDPLARGDLQAIHRTYSSQTLATIYQGPGRVEAWLRGIEIKIADDLEQVTGWQSQVATPPTTESAPQSP